MLQVGALATVCGDKLFEQHEVASYTGPNRTGSRDVLVLTSMEVWDCLGCMCRRPRQM